MLQAYLPDALGRDDPAAGVVGRAPRPAAAPASRCAWSRARTCRWSGSRRRCTAGRWRPGAASRTPTPTTSGSSTTRCTPSGSRNVRVGVAGHNLFDVAYAWLLAGRARRPRRDRVRDAARHGRGPGRGGPARGRRAAALHAGGAPGAVRRRDRVPGPPARGGREPATTSCRRCSTWTPTRRCSRASRTASWPRSPALDDDGAAAAPGRRPVRRRRAAAARAASTTPPTPTRPSPPTGPGRGRSSAGCRDSPARRRRDRRPPGSPTPTALDDAARRRPPRPARPGARCSGAERAAVLHRVGDALEAAPRPS